MKYYFYLCLALLLPVLNAQAQHTHQCGTDHHLHTLRRAHPSVRNAERELEEFTRQFIEQNQGQRSDEVYVMPIVFHIIHQWGEENISNEQIYNQVAILNRDFRMMNEDISDVVDEFQAVAADSRIEFRLATLDPLGNCTNGINRIASVETYVGDDGSKLGGWPRSRYLNVWVVKDMQDGVAGYAYYPSSVIDEFMAPADGIIIRHDYIGSIGTSNESRSRSLTHEIGHWLNLAHTWGDNNTPGVACGDDAVADTPETKGWTSCNLNGATCNAGIVENVQNYMEYSFCSRMFTEGQALRMEAALNSPISFRNNLWTEANLILTGTFGEPVTCAPVAQFYPERNIICLGSDVIFYDNSIVGDVDTWSWTFEDGIPATSNLQNPEVTFNTWGWKTVTLTVTNSNGSSTSSNDIAIYVSPENDEITGLIAEEFPTADQFATFWKRNNFDNNATQWQHTTIAGFQDSQSAMLNAFDAETDLIDNGDNDIDELISPLMNLDPLQTGEFTFRYAYATIATSPELITERLEIWTSINCGESWILRETITGMDLVTAGNVATPFVPANDNQWRWFIMDVPNAVETNNVRFKLVYHSSSYSNNLYIDDVNIVGTVSVDEIDGVPTLSVYPNPTQGQVNVRIPQTVGDQSVLSIFDVSGKEVQRILLNNNQQETTTVNVDCSALSHGVYTVRVQGEKGVAMAKLIIE